MKKNIFLFSVVMAIVSAVSGCSQKEKQQTPQELGEAERLAHDKAEAAFDAKLKKDLEEHKRLYKQ